MTDPELESSKTAIDVRPYAAGFGYAWDRKESWRGSTVMRAPDSDKIIIKRDADGHFSLPPFPTLPKTCKDRIGVESPFARMLEAGRHPYLENDRRLPASLLELETPGPVLY
jgi:hypothetical protein